ncbi:MAG: leucine-rich repeat protein, partial [Lachnospiraceae bacterium]|nr:leucine-rich repeat protein [Lachnospiraceae bacterium]
MSKVTEKKKFKLKKSARLTIAGVCAVTALVVAVIPTRGVQADDPFDPQTMIPATVDDAINTDPFVDATIIPSGQGIWAFPWDSTVTLEGHKYYTINRDGMFGDMTVPIFEISTQATPTPTSVPQCIRNYVGGDASGYTPLGGVLELSPAVIYTLDSDVAEAPYSRLDKGDVSVHDPYTWTRYTETKVEAPKTQRMIEVYNGEADATPPCYYFEVKIETWSVPWQHDPAKDPDDPDYWIEPVDPMDTEPPSSTETIQACKDHMTIVQSIGNDAFKGVANFTRMELLSTTDEGGGAAGIMQIGDSAFEDCTRLQSISLGENFKTIGRKAFRNCTNLTDIDFGTAEQLGDGCFSDCATLTNVTLPNTVTKIGTAAFMNCRSLVDSVPNYPNYLSEDADNINSAIFGGDPGITNTSCQVGSYAFCNCTNLEMTKMCQTTMPVYGTHGQYGMYAGCTNLRYIELPHYATGFQATESMFLDCPHLVCVRGNNTTDTATEGMFINEINEAYYPGKEKTVDDSFVIWGPNPNESSNIEMLKFAEKNSLPYMYWDKYDQKFKYIMTLQESYRFTFTDDFIVESITQLPGAKEKTIRIPANIGGHPIAYIADNACGKFSGSNYVSNLTLPTKIEIPNSIVSIGENAFRACQSVEKVEFISAGENIPAADSTSIGSNCFKDCKKLSEVKFRNDNANGNGYFDINIDAGSVGTDAFLTENPNGLTFFGKMEEGYWPYEYAMDPSNISCSSQADSYITYCSGNPQNISCRYVRPDSSKPGYVSLYRVGKGNTGYPTVNTVVGYKSVEVSPGYYEEKPVRIGDLIDAYYDGEILTPNQEAIINQYTRNVTIPYGIT